MERETLVPDAGERARQKKKKKKETPSQKKKKKTKIEGREERFREGERAHNSATLRHSQSPTG